MTGFNKEKTLTQLFLPGRVRTLLPQFTVGHNAGLGHRGEIESSPSSAERGAAAGPAQRSVAPATKGDHSTTTVCWEAYCAHAQ